MSRLSSQTLGSPTHNFEASMKTPTSLPALISKKAAVLGHFGSNQTITQIGEFVIKYPDLPLLSADLGQHLSEALMLVRQIITDHGSSDKSLIVETMILGKLGRYEEATAVAAQALLERPNWATAIAAANIARRSGNQMETIRLFTQASILDPTDTSAFLEVGDLHLESSRWADALAAYDAALAREKNEAWALTSAFYCRYMITGRKTWLRRLRVAANRPMDECGVEGIMAKLAGTTSTEQGRNRAQFLLWKLETSS